MITFKDVTLPTISGQYWAELNPLGLLKVIYAGDVTSFKCWKSGYEAEQDVSIVLPLNDNFRLLRFSYPYSDEDISIDMSALSGKERVDFTTRTGDIFETRDKKLVFAVCEGNEVTLYTDELISGFGKGVLIESVVLRGPGSPSSKPLTRYRRILNAHNPNLTLIIPEDRVRSCPSGVNNPRISRVFSNIKREVTPLDRTPKEPIFESED